MKTLKYVHIILFFLPVSLVFADIIHVPADMATIQGAINLANPGDTVLVTEGRYIENLKITDKAIILASQFLMDDDTSHISKTIIDGSQPAVIDSATTVVINFNPESSPVLCGFTITGGYGTKTSADSRSIGGIAVIASNAIIEHNIITENIIDSSTVPESYLWANTGGIAAIPLFYNNITVIIRDNIIKNNRVESFDKSSGGGVSLAETSGLKNFNFIVERNIIEANTVKNIDDWKGFGGGIDIQLAIPTSGEQIIRNNLIRRNSVEGEHSFGGGIYVVFVENKASGNVDNSPGPYIYNNIIADNHSDFSGGGVAFFRIYKPTPDSQPQPLTSKGKYVPKPSFINNTIFNNTAPDGAGIFIMNHIPFFMNNILWNSSNPDAEWGEIFIGNVERWIEDNSYGGIEICYSDIQGGWEGEGNRNSEPQFIDTENSDFHLVEGSPGIGWGIDSSIVPKTDYYGNIRPDSIDDTVDMGAIESPYVTDIEKKNTLVPFTFILKQNYPNPFNPKTVIRYSLPVTCHLDLSIYTILGQKVATLVNKRQPAGSYSVQWDASGFATGIYLYRLETDNEFVQTKKLMLLR